MSGDVKTLSVSLAGKFSAADYKNHHQTVDCNGQWDIQIQSNVPYALNAIGTVILPIGAFVACEKCRAAFFLPGFEELVERTIALQLVVNDRLLNNKEIRFLRLAFDLKQSEVAEGIEMGSESYYSKIETGKVSLSPDKQIRLKLLYATKLGVNSAEDYHAISMTNAEREILEPAEVLRLAGPRLKEQLESSFPKARKG